MVSNIARAVITESSIQHPEGGDVEVGWEMERRKNSRRYRSLSLSESASKHGTCKQEPTWKAAFQDKDKGFGLQGRQISVARFEFINYLLYINHPRISTFNSTYNHIIFNIPALHSKNLEL